MNEDIKKQRKEAFSNGHCSGLGFGMIIVGITFLFVYYFLAKLSVAYGKAHLILEYRIFWIIPWIVIILGVCFIVVGYTREFYQRKIKEE